MSYKQRRCTLWDGARPIEKLYASKTKPGQAVNRARKTGCVELYAATMWGLLPLWDGRRSRYFPPMRDGLPYIKVARIRKS